MYIEQYVSLATRTECLYGAFGVEQFTIMAVVPGAKRGHIISSMRNPTAKTAARVTHAVLGLCSELPELAAAKTDVNRLEELGDILWYSAILIDALELAQDGLDFEPLLPSAALVLTSQTYEVSLKDSLNDIHDGILALTDPAKRALFYFDLGTSIPESEDMAVNAAKLEKNETQYAANRAKVRELLLTVFRAIKQVCFLQSVSIDRVAGANIEKLMKRYRARFSSDEAFERDLGEELAVLVKGLEPLS